MESSTNIVHYPSRQAYLENQGVKKAASKGAQSAANEVAKKAPLKKSATKPSKKSPQKSPEKSPKKSAPKTEAKKPTKAKPSVQKGDEIGEAAEHLGKQAVDSAKETLKSTPLKMAAKQVVQALGGATQLMVGEQGESSSVTATQKKSSELSQLKEKFEKSGAKVFFVRGFDWWGMGDDGGLKKMAEELPNASYHSWKDEDQILKEIENLQADTPVILVGHSLGGDMSVSVANKLNRLKSGYRPVDLLVTLDSVGFDNDIIPENVKKNLNFLSESDGLLNDGPNMARDDKLTKVSNELRPEGHMGVDDSPELKRKIFNDIHHVVESRVQNLLEKHES